MKTIGLKIYEYGERDLDKNIEDLKYFCKKYARIKLECNVEHRDLKEPLPFYKKGSNYRLPKAWLAENSKNAQNFDIAIFSFSDEQWRETYDIPMGGYAGAGLVNGVGTIYMTATKGQDEELIEGGKEYPEWTARALHEMSHIVFDDLMGKPKKDTTHFWDYEQKNLLGALKEWDLSDYTPKGTKERLRDKIASLTKKASRLAIEYAKHLLPSLTKRVNALLNREKKSKAERVYEEAIEALGTDVTPSDRYSDEIACAISVCEILQRAGVKIERTAGTWTLWNALKHSKAFLSVENPEAGAVIISPTGTAPEANIRGHVGIVGEDHTIMANVSATGLWSESYTVASWQERWGKAGFPIYYFRPV